MKNTIKVLGIIALVAVIGFSMVACGGDDVPTKEEIQAIATYAAYRGMDSAANVYDLVVKKAAGRSVGRAAFTAQTGDDYELTVTPPNGTGKRSEGAVDESLDGGFVLKPTGATKVFNVAVNGGEIIAIAGEIKYTTGNPETKQVVMPPSVTGGTLISGNTIISGADVAYDPHLANPTAARNINNFPNALDMGGNQGPSVLNISSFLDGTTSITVTGGKVTITVGTPRDNGDENSGLKPFPKELTATPSDAKYFGSDGGTPVIFTNVAAGTEINENTPNVYGLICVLNNDSYAGLVYVDKDVKIKGSDAHDGIIEVMDMDVKAGWNYLFTTKNANFVVYSATKALPAGYKWTVIDRNTEIRLGNDNGNSDNNDNNGQNNGGGDNMLTGTWILYPDHGIQLLLYNDTGTFRMSEKAQDGRYIEKEIGTFRASNPNITVTTTQLSTERLRQNSDWASLTFDQEWYTQNELESFLFRLNLSTKNVAENFKTQDGTYSITNDPPRILRLTIGGEEMAFDQQQ